MRVSLVVPMLFVAVILQLSCGSSGSGNSGPTSVTGAGGGGGGTGSSVPLFPHVFLAIEENHSFSDVIGNSNMPYLNGLVSANGLATQYFADAHPSLPNYFTLTTGEGTSIIGTVGDSFDGVVTQDNVVRALTAAGKSWKCYAESLPSPGYLGTDSGAYVRHHNPSSYLSDVQNSASQASNIVPLTQLATDLSDKLLPDYAFIVPDVNNDATNCPPGFPFCSPNQNLPIPTPH